MATAEMAAMLDELMGRNRNAGPNEKVIRGGSKTNLMTCMMIEKDDNKLDSITTFFPVKS